MLGAEADHGRARHPQLGGDGLPPARAGPPQPLRDPLRNVSCVNLYVEFEHLTISFK